MDDKSQFSKICRCIEGAGALMLGLGTLFLGFVTLYKVSDIADVVNRVHGLDETVTEVKSMTNVLNETSEGINNTVNNSNDILEEIKHISEVSNKTLEKISKALKVASLGLSLSPIDKDELLAILTRVEPTEKETGFLPENKGAHNEIAEAWEKKSSSDRDNYLFCIFQVYFDRDSFKIALQEYN